MPERTYLFVCDHETETECLAKKLVGSPQANAIWALQIKENDYIYLINVNTRVARGPYLALTAADCHDSTAWHGRFPVQVKIATTALTKNASAHSAGAPHFLLQRRLRHSLKEYEASELFSWIQQCGTPTGI